MKEVQSGGVKFINTSYGKYWVEFDEINPKGTSRAIPSLYSYGLILPFEFEMNTNGIVDVHFNLYMPDKETVIEAVSRLRNRGYNDMKIAQQLLASEELVNCLAKEVVPPFFDGIRANYVERFDGAIMNPGEAYRGYELHACIFDRSDLVHDVKYDSGLNLK